MIHEDCMYFIWQTVFCSVLSPSMYVKIHKSLQFFFFSWVDSSSFLVTYFIIKNVVTFEKNAAISWFSFPGLPAEFFYLLLPLVDASQLKLISRKRRKKTPRTGKHCWPFSLFVFCCYGGQLLQQNFICCILLAWTSRLTHFNGPYFFHWNA